MMSLHNEDRELQIRLAELQADVQINLTICFGLLAICFAVIIGLQQIYFTLSPEKNELRNSILIAMVGCLIIVSIVTSTYLNKANRARKQIGELRERYVW